MYGTDLRLDKFYTGKEKRRMDFSFIYEGLLSITPQQAVMYLVGALLIYLAIKKEYEPSLLLPMGFGAILVNPPLSGVINQGMTGSGRVTGVVGGTV